MHAKGFPTSSEYFAPVGYSRGWLVLGIALLLVCLAWVFWLFFTARKRSDVESVAGASESSTQALRESFLERLSIIEHQHGRGEITLRQCHRAISRTLREFAEAASGIPASKMTLQELRQTELRSTADAVAFSYPFEFTSDVGPSHVGSVDKALSQARHVVNLWG